MGKKPKTIRVVPGHPFHGHPGFPGGAKKKGGGCCSMVAAGRAVRRGNRPLAVRYAKMSARLIAARFVKITEGAHMRISTMIATAIVSLFAILAVGSAPAVAVSADRAPAAPAMAAMSGPDGYLTFWDGCNGGPAPVAGECGAAWVLTASGGIGVCHSVPTGSNDRWSAFDNRTGHNFRVWTNGGCTGQSAVLYNGTETGQIDPPFNNSISSQERIS